MAVEEFGGSSGRRPRYRPAAGGGDGGSRHFKTGSGVSPARTENVGG